jgi:hypothetical protein
MTNSGSVLVTNNYLTLNLSPFYITGAGEENYQITSNILYKNGTGIRVGANGTLISNNRITDCNNRPGTTTYGLSIEAGCSEVYVLNNYCLNNGDIVDHGDCEVVSAPHITSDGSSLSSCTFARSSVVFYTGAFSYLFTKTVASGTAAYAWLVDNNTTTDMHGLSIKQVNYKMKTMAYIATAAAVCSEVGIIVSKYSSGVWSDTTAICSATYGAWQPLEATLTLTATVTGIRAGIVASSALVASGSFYVDNIQLIPMGVANEHQNNLYDAGVDTQVG